MAFRDPDKAVKHIKSQSHLDGQNSQLQTFDIEAYGIIAQTNDHCVLRIELMDKY